MAPFPLDKHTAGCNSQHNWQMSLAMDLATLGDMHVEVKMAQWMPFGCFQC